MEEGKHKGEYALKNVIFDILKYLYIVESNMTEQDIEQAHQKIIDLHEEILSEQNLIARQIKDGCTGEKLLFKYQSICAILIMFNELIENASISINEED